MWVTFTMDKTADNDVVFLSYQEENDERRLPGHVSTPELIEFVLQKAKLSPEELISKGSVKPTVCRVVGNITDLIIRELFPKVVQFPDATGRRSVAHAFYKIGKFPGVTGCIDCTHVRIKSPYGDDAEVFRNRKGCFFINVQAITGPELQFFDVVACWPGSVHDNSIFDNCRAKVLYEEAVMTGVLLGDMGYACTSYLIIPLEDPGKAGSPHDKYNKAQIKTRNSIERAFGVWKWRFPCLHMRLQHKPERSAAIITACAALHNLGRHLLDPLSASCAPAPTAKAPAQKALATVAAASGRHGNKCRDTKLDLYIAQQMMAAAWTATKRSVIANCFTHLGFKLGGPDAYGDPDADYANGDQDADSAEDNETVRPPGEAVTSWAALQDAGTAPSGVALEDFIDADKDVIAHEEVSDEDIIRSVRDEAQSDEDDVPDLQPPPSMACVLDAFDILRNYVAAHDDDLAMNLLAECENRVMELLTRKRKQASSWSDC
ncbi:hypothetical protein HPB47_006462 [Ixodes persulcatus]|uniref:Uncharacterized protein n=1 Tax=Ixodes persulcatus TaxID=34615 RepID=A0AC60PB56_IXOPE|nr:hypothetical protein HPB47_006462 [Ixodes persulcatus]